MSTRGMEENREHKVKLKLFVAVREEKWEKVVKMFHKYPQFQATKITRSGDTSLHLAITHGAPDDKVQSMIEEIKNKENAVQILSAKNNACNTPLHCAASRGSLPTCLSLISVEQSLVEKRNEKGETPLFLAALNGHKDAFICLHGICKKDDRSSYWRRGNGDTILHCTIQRKHFDLSLLIIDYYKDIAGSVNEDGRSPLDILASTPSAFWSGTHLSWWEKLCYSFICVEKYDIDQVDPDRRDKYLKVLEKNLQIRTLGSIRKMKERHVWGDQILEELVKRDSWYDYSRLEKEMEDMSSMKRDDDESNIVDGTYSKRESEGNQKCHGRISSPLLTAAKHGLIEPVRRILEEKPFAIEDHTSDNKNIVLVAIEERQSRILKELRNHPPKLWNEDMLMNEVDDDRNNALHLAAKLSDKTSWETKSAMHMQWELRWFEHARKIMPSRTTDRRNKDGQTPWMMFLEQHKDLLKASNQWLKDASAAYTVASAVVISVTFGTCYQVPGGNKDNGKAVLIGDLGFDIFSIAVLFALSFSVTALAAFLAVYSSQKQPGHYLRDLPLKLMFGLASLFVSIIATLVAFYAANSYQVNHGRMRKAMTPVYVITLLPACFYIAAHFPLFWSLLRASFSRAPHPARKLKDEDVIPLPQKPRTEEPAIRSVIQEILKLPERIATKIAEKLSIKRTGTEDSITIRIQSG